MTLTNAMRAAAFAASLMTMAGTSSSALGQSETKTVRERVVVTLPNGKRIVRVVEKQVEVATKTASTGGGDPFVAAPDSNTAGGSTAGGGTGGSGNTNNLVDPRILGWLDLYQSGDMAADANGDGKLSPADYSAFLMSLRDTQPADDGSDDGSDDDDKSDGGNTDDGGDDGSTGGGSGGTGGDAGGGTGVDQEAGWTQLSPSSDSQVFFVASNGDDGNDGLSPDRPLRTVNEGVRRLRDGKPDWLLLRRGDTFSEIISSNWTKSGRSADEKMVISAYGEGPRPKLITGNSSAITIVNNNPRRHVAFTSLRFEPGVRHQAGAIRFISYGVEDFLFEDLHIQDYQNGMLFQSNGDAYMHDITIRRNIIADSAGSTHSQGIFAHYVDGLVMEENVLDRNGWDYRQGRDATATIFAHNVYLQRTVKNVVFRNNFTGRASSHGIQARLGGILEGNVAWGNAIGILFGNEGVRGDEPPVHGVVNDNVVIESTDISSILPRGWGIHVQHTENVEAKRNIIANSTVDADLGFGMIVWGKLQGVNRGLIVADNVFDDFGETIRIDERVTLDVTFRDNLVNKSAGSKGVVKHEAGQDAPGLRYEGNLYSHGRRTDAFTVGNDRLDINEWQADYDPQGGSLLSDFRNGDATLESYALSVGFSSLDAFLEAMRNQRKGSWDSRVTPQAMRAYFRDAFTLQTGG